MKFDAFAFVAFSTLIAIVNPLGAMGPFLAMTVGESTLRRRQIAWRAAVVSGGVLAGGAMAGAFIFRFFGITFPALKIAGGILLFFVSFEMINAKPSRTKQTDEEQKEGIHKQDVAVFPLAIPLLAGPGALVSVFMLADRATNLWRQSSLYLAIVMTVIVIYFTLREANRVVHVMGQIGINVMSRLMGLILAAIAIQFVIDGVHGAFQITALK